MNQEGQLKIPYEGMKAIEEIQNDIKLIKKQMDTNILQECNKYIDALTEELCQSCKFRMYKDSKLSNFAEQIQKQAQNFQQQKIQLEATLYKVQIFLEQLVYENKYQDYYSSGEITIRGSLIQEERAFKSTINKYIDSLLLQSLENNKQIKQELEENFKVGRKEFVDKLYTDQQKDYNKMKIYIIQLKMLIEAKKRTQKQQIQEIVKLKQELIDHNQDVDKENLKQQQEISKLKNTLEVERNAVKKYLNKNCQPLYFVKIK
ncbi:hypothetical protein pb186bvf_004975 [Paramecium bursaria]